jgi:peptide deformylase
MKIKIPNKFKFVDTVLHDAAEAFKFDTPEKNLHLANKMLEFMKQSNGIGLAAPQIGISARLFVMQTKFDTGGMAMHCFNPRIISHGNQYAQIEEGCLSFPGETMVIKRPAQIEVEYHNHKGDITQAILWGINAICFQHELDHLNGIVMHDRFKEQNDNSKN